MKGTVAILLLCAAGPVKAWDTEVSSYINQCSQDSVDFTFKLQYNQNDWYEATCNRSYKRCPFSDGTCLGNSKLDWTAEQGETFEYLETRTFYCSKDSTPSAIYMEDTKGYQCARALNKGNDPIDFFFNTDVDISSWWDATGKPLHMTIVPFNADNGDCANPQGAKFDATRALAVWISPYAGQTEDPGSAGAVYCDVSQNPQDCLNAPYFEVDSSNSNQMVLRGTLHNVLQSNPSEVSVYVPEGYDMDLPITNTDVFFDISNDLQNCLQFISDGTTSCNPSSGWQWAEETYTKLTVSGLGRINGWTWMRQQQEWGKDTGANGTVDSVKAGMIFSWGYLVALASKSQDSFAIDVSGVEVAWGSRLHNSAVALNSPWSSGDGVCTDCPSKMYDVKLVGMWNDRADGPDMNAQHSLAQYSYIHANDDAVKVNAEHVTYEQSTVLKGNAGSVVMLSGYGTTNIDNSLVDGVFAHRIVHSSGEYQGCGKFGNFGGVVATRSQAYNSNGLVDATISNLYIPELGSINSVATPFGIGVKKNGGNVNSYPIRNLKFEYFQIWPEPNCMSNFYDPDGVVQWGYKQGGYPAAWFYDEDKSDKDNCDFEGAVFMSDEKYFVCGFPESSDAEKYCMSTSSTIGGEPNVSYAATTNVFINFPTCGYAGQSETVSIIA